jgi:hypothetical protein
MSTDARSAANKRKPGLGRASVACDISHPIGARPSAGVCVALKTKEILVEKLTKVVFEHSQAKNTFVFRRAGRRCLPFRFLRSR